MSDKIQPHHRKRRALVYVRQSTEAQVRTNTESLRRQRALKARAVALGWAPSQVELIEDDLGLSGASCGERGGFRRLLESVRVGEVGLILAVEASRLARNSLDWQRLMQYCAFTGVLLGDEERLYDPSDPNDGVVLGVQGTLAEYEWFMLRGRMDKGFRQKAGRGELFCAVSPGYVYVRSRGLVKHPNQRVRRAIEKVFLDFETCPSVYELYRRLCREGFLLPAPARGGEPDQIDWVEPHYHRLTRMLKNPVYAGIYAFGQTRTEKELQADGQVRKRRRRVESAAWDVVIEDCVPAYIPRQQYEHNREKIAMNASHSGNRVQTAAQKGPGLAVGLLRCRRCGHKLGVRYGSGGGIRYYCRQGLPQRGEPTGRCFSFLANALESQLVESILYAVSPAGVEAADAAARQMRQERESRRQRLADAVEERRYDAELTRRRLDHVDPDRRLVFDTLTEEWEAALRALEEEQDRLNAFDRNPPETPTAEQRRELAQLGQDLERAWFHPRADMTLKKEIVRTLVEEIVADVDEASDEIVWLVHWAGGRHTELRCPRSTRPVRSRPEELQSVIDTLRKLHDDAGIARVLNRAGVKTERQENWTARRVRGFRQRHEIPAYSITQRRARDWMSQQEAATYLEVSPMSVHRLITRHILPAEYHPGFPSVICRDDLELKAVKKAVQAMKRHGNSPLPENSKVLSLFPTTNC